jgi:hypothetical protein
MAIKLAQYAARGKSQTATTAGVGRQQGLPSHPLIFSHRQSAVPLASMRVHS